jgi:hypothetical protein
VTRIGIDRRQQLRQHLEDCHLGAGASVDMAEFERDDAAADKHDIAGQCRVVQHIIGDRQLVGAVDRQVPRLRAGGDDDMRCL